MWIVIVVVLTIALIGCLGYILILKRDMRGVQKADRMKQVFLDDEGHSQPLDGMEHRMNPRFMARLCESVARLFSPLL